MRNVIEKTYKQHFTSLQESVKCNTIERKHDNTMNTRKTGISTSNPNH